MKTLNSDSRIVVTGGAGFIGSAVCRLLIGTFGATVINIDKLTYAGTLTSLGEFRDDPRHIFVKADICDRDAMARVLRDHRPDALIHLAAETHVDRSIDGAQVFLTTNIMGTASLLETVRHWLDDEGAARRGDFRFLHVSTDEVFGSLGATGAFSETSPYDPSSPYSASKASADHLVRAWQRTYGLPLLMSNCSNNYGPYQFPEKLIPLLILNACEERALPIYGDGGNIRDWLHVEDHARALLDILRAGEIGQSYNVGARSERTNLQIVETICTHLDERFPERAPHRRLIRFVPDRPGHDRRYAIDPTKLSGLGWKPQVSFDQGLASTIDWYLAHRDWWQPLRRSYAGERLGAPPGGRG